MSDLAFNNYCIACDKLCSQSSIYCSEACKASDEHQSSSLIPHNDSGSETGAELVSPLLTPSMYQHYSPYKQAELTNSPLFLSEESEERDLDYFDLNYTVQSKTNYTLATTSTASSNTDLISSIPSTSHNYRKWLTACL